MIGTHPDADHIGGLDVIIYKFDCGEVLLPDYQKNTKTYDEVESDFEKPKVIGRCIRQQGITYQLGRRCIYRTAPADKKI